MLDYQVVIRQLLIPEEHYLDQKQVYMQLVKILGTTKVILAVKLKPDVQASRYHVMYLYHHTAKIFKIGCMCGGFR